MSNFLLKNIREVGGGIGGDDQCAFAFIGITYCMSTGHAGLANTALAREENKLGHFVVPFNAALTSSALGYAPTLITLPRTTMIGRASICFSRTRFITSALPKKALGLLAI